MYLSMVFLEDVSGMVDVAPLLPAQDTVQIGNQLPGLKMRSIVVGGVSEDKVSVQRGFRGCIQVRQSRGASTFPPPSGRHRAACTTVRAFGSPAAFQ